MGEDKIKLNVVDPDGIGLVQVEAPKNWRVETLVNEFVKKKSLPKIQGDSAITYAAVLKRNNTELVSDKTILESGLQDDDTVRLKKSLSAKNW